MTTFLRGIWALSRFRLRARRVHRNHEKEKTGVEESRMALNRVM